MNAQKIRELFRRQLDPDVEAQALRSELAAMSRRHARARKPIVDRLTQLARAADDIVIPFPGPKA